MVEHLEAMHLKIKKHICDKCGHATSWPQCLAKHMFLIHGIGRCAGVSTDLHQAFKFPHVRIINDHAMWILRIHQSFTRKLFAFISVEFSIVTH